MADFLRLTLPTYMGGLPATHDYINNYGGTPAPADGAKSGGHPQDGTFFVAFGEDGLALHANRPHKALAANTDFLDDVVSGEVPIPTELSVTAPGGAVTKKQLTSTSMFVGISGTYSDTQFWRDRLVEVLDPVSGDELRDGTGARIRISAIKKSDDSTNAVGNEVTGFTANPFIYFSPAIPSGQDYILSYGKQESLVGMVKDKTGLDAMTRLLGGKARNTAEYQTLIQQIVRTTGTNPALVDAVVGSVFETPDDGNLKAKTDRMVFDVDPSDDAGATYRDFLWQAGRDGSLRNMLTLAENAKGGSACLLSTGLSQMYIGDGNMTANNGLMGLTDSTHNVIRLWEADRGFQDTLFSMLNGSRWMATIGDGTNTFGDFEGTGAISTAIAWFVANAPSQVDGLILFIKAGSYQISSTITLPANKRVVIIGESREGVSIDNSLTVSNPAIEIPTTGHLEIENVTFVEGNSSAHAIDVYGVLRMRRCTLDTQGIQILGSSGVASGRTVVVEDCDISYNAGSSGAYATIRVAMDNVSTPGFGDILFRNCALYSGPTNPLLDIKANGSGTGTLGNVVFERCKIYIASQTAAAGPNPDGDPGVIHLDPHSTAFLEVESVQWLDTNVLVTGANNASIMMYCRQYLSDFIDIKKMVISGGRWTVSTSVTTITPFYTGGWTAGTDPHIWEFIIEDVVLGWTGTNADYGASAAELSNSVFQAAFFISAREVRVRNIRFEKWFPRGRGGELWLCPYGTADPGVGGYLDVDGIHFGERELGVDYGHDDYRVYVHGYGNQRHGRIRRLVIDMPTESVSRVDKGALGLDNSKCIAEDCEISGFNYAGDAAIYVASSGHVIRRCRLTTNSVGILNSGDASTVLEVSECLITGGVYGINLYVAQSSGQYIDPIIRNNTIANCSGNHVSIAPDNTASDLCITGNRMYGGSSQRIRLGSDGVASAASLVGIIDGNDLDRGSVHVVGGPTSGGAMDIIGVVSYWDTDDAAGSVDWNDKNVSTSTSLYLFNNNAYYSQESYEA